MSVQQGPLDVSLLAGSVAVVTGCANKGIGWGLCKKVAELGMSVCLVDLHEGPVTAAVAEFRQLYPSCRVLGVACDVTSEDSMAALVRTVAVEFPGQPLGAVFANAGVIFNGTIVRSSLADFKTTFDVNVLGVVNTLKQFVPVAQRQSSPCIIAVTSSVAGLLRGDGGTAAYAGSKHAVVAICESLSFELARRSPHVRIHVICPCQVASALGHTSQNNRAAKEGQLAAGDIQQVNPVSPWFMMSADAHAQQVFDKIERGLFYILTENERPYVDHDFPFGAQAILKEQHSDKQQLRLDNSDAFTAELRGWPMNPPLRSAILKGPMFTEMWRRHKKGEPNTLEREQEPVKSRL